jgi:hypothetical protein
LQRRIGNRNVQRVLRTTANARIDRAEGVQTDSELMWRQLKETVTSPKELFSYTPLGWSATDWKNAGKTLVGYGKGVGQVVAAPAVFTYYATGSLLYNADPEFYSHYRQHDAAFKQMTAAMGEAFKSPDAFAKFVVEGFTSGLEQMSAGLREGDAEKAGAGIGNFTLSVLTVAEGGQGGSIKLVLEPAAGTVATAGMRLVLTAPPNAVPAVAVLMANAANQKGSKSGAGSQQAGEPPSTPPKNRREPGRLPPGEKDLKPGTSPLGEGDIDVYGSGSGRKGSRVGDQLEMHEPWQSSDLVDKMVADARGKGASRKNPAVALGEELHDKVTARQRALGLFDKTKTSSMSAREIIETNARAMREAGVAREIIQESRKEALRFAAQKGKLSAKELADIAASEGWDRTLDLGQ